MQWVNPPFGEWYWTESAVSRNLKISAGTQPWTWAGREPPPPMRELAREQTPPPAMTLAGMVGDLYLYAAGPGREYAAIAGADGSRTVCRAEGVGGDITVTCDAPVGGALTVLENRWPGWQARVDGRPAQIGGDSFITIPVPPGAHTVTLRYRPVDAFAGIALMLLGVALAVYLWMRDRRPAAPEEVSA